MKWYIITKPPTFVWPGYYGRVMRHKHFGNIKLTLKNMAFEAPQRLRTSIKKKTWVSLAEPHVSPASPQKVEFNHRECKETPTPFGIRFKFLKNYISLSSTFLCIQWPQYVIVCCLCYGLNWIVWTTFGSVSPLIKGHTCWHVV